MSSADLITSKPSTTPWACSLAERASTLLSVDPSVLDDVALAEHTLEFERLRSQFDAAEMRVLQAAGARQAHRVDRHRSSGTWLSAELRQNRAAAKRRFRAATVVVEQLPVVLASLEDGQIHDDHVRLLLSAEHRGLLVPLIRDQQVLVRWATTETFPTFREFFEAWCVINDPRDPATLDQKAFDDRRLIWADGLDGTVMIEVDTTNLVFAQLQGALKPTYERLLVEDWRQARAEHGADACTAQLSRTDRQRWHDALIAVVRAGAAGRDPGAAVVVNIVVDAETLDRAADGTAQPRQCAQPHKSAHGRPSTDAERYRAETLGGQRLSPPQILTCALAGHIRRVTLSADSLDFEMSKKARLFKGPKRVGLMIRDRHCQGDGCDVRADHCQADHIVPHPRAGPTTPRNGQMLCSACHRHKTMLETTGLVPTGLVPT